MLSRESVCIDVKLTSASKQQGCISKQVTRTYQQESNKPMSDASACKANAN